MSEITKIWIFHFALEEENDNQQDLNLFWHIPSPYLETLSSAFRFSPDTALIPSVGGFRFPVQQHRRRGGSMQQSLSQCSLNRPLQMAFHDPIKAALAAGRTDDDYQCIHGAAVSLSLEGKAVNAET